MLCNIFCVICYITYLFLCKVSDFICKLRLKKSVALHAMDLSAVTNNLKPNLKLN